MGSKLARSGSAAVSAGVALLALASGSGSACRPAPPPPADAHAPPDGPVDGRSAPLLAPAGAPGDAGLDAALRAWLDAGAAPGASAAAAATAAASDPMALHQETRDGLLALVSLRAFTEKEERVIRPASFLRAVFGTDGPGRINQGNKALASHTISKEQCLKGLEGMVLQTPEQRALCGAENMVPVWTKGKEPWFCIDIFEFPNKACELPVVWAPPTWDRRICELQGKRLCSDIEWNVACRGDPEGGPDRRYAYGDELDLEICHTNLPHRSPATCSARDAKTAWQTCSTDTEPSGAFPRCRSRFGVFDQHGNVAEVMMRREGDRVLTQLKGSAWFYVQLAREPGKPVPPTTKDKQGAYPDHCNFDPRWHVEEYDKGAWHVNYHLGFRCCKSIP